MCWLPWQLRERTQLSCLKWPGKACLENVTFEPGLKVNGMVTRQRRGYLDKEAA